MCALQTVQRKYPNLPFNVSHSSLIGMIHFHVTVTNIQSVKLSGLQVHPPNMIRIKQKLQAKEEICFQILNQIIKKEEQFVHWGGFFKPFLKNTKNKFKI